MCWPLGLAWPHGAVVWLWNVDGNTVNTSWGICILGAWCIYEQPLVMPAQERLSWEAAVFAVGMVWWMGSYAYPPQWKHAFVRDRQKMVLQHQEVRFVPMMWLLPCAIPALSRDANSVLWVTLVRGQILS